MAKEHAAWSFESDGKAFDGARVMREARVVGLQILEIHRGKETYVFWTDAYMRRLREASLDTKFIWRYAPQGWVPFMPEHSNTLCARYDVSVSASHGKNPYCYMMSGILAAEVHEELIKREKIIQRNRSMRPRTQVKGYR